MSKRFANVNSTLQNLSALASLGHDVILVTKLHRNKTVEQVEKDVKDACLFFNVAYNFRVNVVKTINVFNTNSVNIRLEAYYVAIAVKLLNVDFVWSRHIFPVYMCVKLKIPTVFEHHTLLTPSLKRLITKIKDDKYFKLFLAISNKHKMMIEDVVHKSKILPLHSGVDFTTIQKIKKDHLADMKISANKKIVYAGSFYEGRGIEVMISLAELLPQYEVECIGATEESFLEYEESLKRLRNLSFIMKLPRYELIKRLMTAECLIAPYSSFCETVDGIQTIAYASPMKIMEYLAMGKPIISIDIGAIPEVISNGENGILLLEGDLEGMKRILEEILKNEELKNNLSKKAVLSAENFSWINRVKKVIENFE